MKVLVVCLVLACAGLSSAVPWVGSPLITSVEISGCDNDAEYCEFPKNSNVDFSFTFTSNSTASMLKVFAAIYDFDLEDFTLISSDYDDACSVVECPLRVGETYTYSNSFFVDPAYAESHVNVLWALEDENKKDVVSVSFDGKIVGEK